MASQASAFLKKLESDEKMSFGKTQEEVGRLFLSRHRTFLRDLYSALKWLKRIVCFRFQKKENELFF